jgi:glucokinase
VSGLIADIGGTNARFALVGDDGSMSDVKVMKCSLFPTLVEVCHAYLEEAASIRPRRAALAVASPVTGDRVTMTNHHWSFSIEETRRQLGLDKLDIINDFVAVARAVPHLAAGDTLKVGGGEPRPGYPIAVFGPGTGLGTTALLPSPSGWWPLATEGGHVTLAAATDRESEVLAVLRREMGHVSAERVLSGPGLVNLYRALAHIIGETPDRSVSPADITGRALSGASALCGETVALFTEMLGTFAANLALTLDARGGVYIAGGIVPKLGPAFITSGFRSRFEDKGRFSAYLAAIPTFLIVREHPALVGLAHFIRQD